MESRRTKPKMMLAFILSAIHAFWHGVKLTIFVLCADGE